GQRTTGLATATAATATATAATAAAAALGVGGAFLAGGHGRAFGSDVLRRRFDSLARLDRGRRGQGGRGGGHRGGGDRSRGLGLGGGGRLLFGDAWLRRVRRRGRLHRFGGLGRGLGLLRLLLLRLA